jgi:HD-like signal output (HDOD) protein
MPERRPPMAGADLKRFIAKVEDLPTLPRTVLRITELINDPRASAKDLARIITDDQVLTARLLKLVNSSFYGFPQRIATVTDAILLIGFDAIRSLLLTTSVFDLFPSRKLRSRKDQEMLWDHSLGCAVGAKVIGGAVRHEKIEELFVAGLLHDIGKIVEMTLLPEDFARIAARVAESRGLISAAEMDVLGCTHADLGRHLSERWNLPAKLVAIIAWHHTPMAAGAFTAESCIVHLADILARALQLGSGGDDRVPQIDHAAWDLLKLKSSSLDEIMAAMLDEFEDISSFLR